MKLVTDYRILTHYSPTEMEISVNQIIAEGFQPYGPLRIVEQEIYTTGYNPDGSSFSQPSGTSTTFYQVMVRYGIYDERDH